MNSSNGRILFCLGALFFSLCCRELDAQVPVPPNQPPAKPAMQFRTLGADCAPDGLNYQLGSNAVSISVQQGNRSLPYDYTGASPLVLFRIVTGKDGKLVHQPVVSVNLSQAGTYPLLVFFKGKTPDQPIVSVLKEDAVSFPAGTFRVVNDSGTPLSAAFPGGAIPVPPASTKDYHGKEGGIFQVGITEIDPTGPFLAFNSNVGILPGKRIMFLVLPASSPGGHVQIQRHTDGVPLP
jgi:hypothetical protein